MSDTYQPIYDAVRASIRNANIGDAVQSAIRDLNLSHYAEMMQRAFESSAAQYERPSVVHRPKLFADGDMWCALLGDDIQSGLCAFGKTALEAMWNFDIAFAKERTPQHYINEKNQQEKEDNGQFGVGA